MSQRFHFRGRVLPEIAPLSISYRPVVARGDVPGEPAATYAPVIENGVIVVGVEVDASEFDHLRLHGPAYDLVRAMAELASLADGIAYHVELNEAVFPNGRVVPLFFGDQRLAACIQAFRVADMGAVIDLVLTEPEIARALSDAVSVMSWPHYSPIACGRVADSLRRLLTKGDARRDWARLHEVLRVDRAYVQPLSDYSAPPRHGERQEVSGEVTSDLAARAWTLFDRYLTYRLGGDVPLAAGAFPILRG